MSLRSQTNTEPGGDRFHKIKVAQIESESLKTTIEDLESNLSLNRQLVNDMLLGMKCDLSQSDRTDVAPYVSHKIMEALLAEKSLLQDRIKFVELDQKDAINKANYAEKIIRDSNSKESKLYQDTENRIDKLIAESESKEKMIRELEVQMKSYEKEIELFNLQIEKQPTPVKLVNLFNKKLRHIQNITSKLRANLTRVEYQRLKLKNRCKDMYIQLSRVSLQIMDSKHKPQNKPVILEEPDDVYFDDFYKSEEYILDASFVEKFDLNTDPCREKSSFWENKGKGRSYSFCDDISKGKFSLTDEDKIKKKLKKLKQRLEENHIKLETLTLESVGAARLNESLRDDQEILHQALEKSLQEEKRLEAAILKFGEQPKIRSIPRKQSVKSTIKKGKSHSNPLDYAGEKCSELRLTAINQDIESVDHRLSFHSEISLELTQKANISLEEDKEMPSMILQRDEDLGGDSLIEDMFNLQS